MQRTPFPPLFHEERPAILDPGRSSGLWFVLLLTPSRLTPVATREVRPHLQRRDRKGFAPFSLCPSLSRVCRMNVGRRQTEVKRFPTYFASPTQRSPSELERVFGERNIRPAVRATAGRLDHEPPRITL